MSRAVGRESLDLRKFGRKILDMDRESLDIRKLGQHILDMGRESLGIPKFGQYRLSRPSFGMSRLSRSNFGCPDFRDPRLDSSSDFPDSQSWHDYAIWVLMRMQRDSSPDFPDFRPRLSILKLSARLCNLGLDRMLCDPRSNHGATLAKTVRLFRPRRGRRDFRDQGGNGATLQNKARSAQLSRPRRTWRRRLSKLAYIGLKGASRNISRSVNQKWISQNRTKGGPIGSAGGRIPEGGGRTP